MKFFYDNPLNDLDFIGVILLFYFTAAGVYFVFNVYKCMEDLKHAAESSGYFIWMCWFWVGFDNCKDVVGH